MTTREKFYENLKKFNYKLKNEDTTVKTIQEKVIVIHDDTEYEVVFRNFADGYLPHRNNSNKIKNIENFKKIVFELVGDEFEVLPNQVYKNNKTPIKMKHKKCGNIIDTLTPNTFLSGKRCKYCAGHYTPTLEEVKIKINEITQDYELYNENEYTNLTTEVLMHHKNCGNIYKVTLHNFFNGARCPKCSHRSFLKEDTEFKDEVCNLTNNEFKVLDKYIDCRTPIRIQHINCGHIQTVKPYIFLHQLKNKCPNCKVTNESILEREVRDYINSLGITTKKFKKKISNKWYEIDIYVPDLKIGFEFNGLYWHSENIHKSKLNLFEKMKAYESENIRIINIFEDEWTKNKDLVKTKIANILNKNSQKKIYARMCEIKEIAPPEKNEFLNKYHIQGEDKALFSYGLFYKNELVAVMTMCKLRASLGNKNDSEGTYELSRFATKYHVIGGFSKLLKNIINLKEEIKIVKTYADLRWSSKSDNVYIKNNFSLIKESKPSYWYTDTRRRFHRYNFRKGVLKEKFPDLYDPNLTEHQIMDKTPYKRIWDCGNLVYEWKR